MENEKLSTNETARLIKKHLRTIFPGKVSVTTGRGTAHGWIDIRVEADPPTICGCQKGQPYCQNCVHEIRTQSRRIREKISEMRKTMPLNIYTYTSDDGFNEDNDCLTIQVNFPRI